MVPSVVGLWWSRRDHLMCALLPSFIRRNGNTTFAQNGIVLDGPYNTDFPNESSFSACVCRDCRKIMLTY